MRKNIVKIQIDEFKNTIKNHYFIISGKDTWILDIIYNDNYRNFLLLFRYFIKKKISDTYILNDLTHYTHPYSWITSRYIPKIIKQTISRKLF